jgi:DNA polymerase III delta prime subunit
MTKSAQQALKYLLREVSSEVRFCLICNYISRIDETLQNGFVRLRFNKLPENQIISFLRNICVCEKIPITDETLYGIRRRFVNDIRSMINYIQMNNSDIDINIVNPVIWDGLFSVETMSDPGKFRDYFERASDIRNTSKRSIIKNLMNYIIRERPQHTGAEILVFFEKIMHNCECPDKEMNEYFIRVGYEFKSNCGGGGGGGGGLGE